MGRMIIKGGTIVNAEGTVEADLIVEGEQIAGIVKDAQPGPDDRVIDAKGKLVLPGVVDAHTHIQLDTGIYKTADNWEIGTKAAAAGGVTTVIDFANQIRGKPFEAGLEVRKREAADAIIDYSFHFVVLEPASTYEEMDTALETLLDLGVTSLKLFTTYRPNYYLDDAALLRVFNAMPSGMIALVHAENDAIVTSETERLVQAGETEWKYHGQARPFYAEAEAINRVAYLAYISDAAVYFVHCTNLESINLIQQAREVRERHDSKLSRVICETCPQYLLLDDSLYDGPQPERFILQPPLRDKDNLHGMWLRLMAGSIDVVSTDSCDYTLQQKTEHPEFTKTPGGLPGVETILSLIYTCGVCEVEDFTQSILAAKLAANPAKIFGLYPRKGALQVGSDADIVLYDPEPEWTLSHTDLHYVAGYSPYEGMQIKGRVAMTIARGEVIYEYGKADPFAGAKVGRGRFVPGKPFDPSLVL